jgi:hypothetical protein
MNWTSSCRSGFTRFTRVRLVIDIRTRAGAALYRMVLSAISTLRAGTNECRRRIGRQRKPQRRRTLPPASSGCGIRSESSKKKLRNAPQWTRGGLGRRRLKNSQSQDAHDHESTLLCSVAHRRWRAAPSHASMACELRRGTRAHGCPSGPRISGDPWSYHSARRGLTGHASPGRRHLLRFAGAAN